MLLRNLQDLTETGVSHNPLIRKRVMVSNGEIPTLTNFSTAVFPPGAVATGHAHTDMTETFFVVRGAGRARINGVICQLRQGDCLVVEPGEHHELSSDDDSELELIYFGLLTSGP